MKNLKICLLITLLSFTLGSCSAIAGIFKAGMGFGIFIVIAVIVIIVGLLARSFNKRS